MSDSSEKSYISPFDLHNEQASLIPMFRSKPKPSMPTGGEIACIVGGVDEEPIRALFHPATRTVYPVRETNK